MAMKHEYPPLSAEEQKWAEIRRRWGGKFFIRDFAHTSTQLKPSQEEIARDQGLRSLTMARVVAFAALL
eukprot:scaffold1060_cov246-Pinguiococcus_pyrenoidosus.AAC.18